MPQDFPLPYVVFNNTIERKKFLWEHDFYEYWIAMILLNGSFSLTMEGTHSTVEAGNVVVYPPGVFFQRRIVQPIRSLYIRFDVRMSGPEENMQLNFGKHTPVGCLDFQDTDRIAADIAFLSAIANQHSEQAITLANHYFRDIWFEYMHVRDIREIRENEVVGDPIIAETIQYFQKNFTDPIMISQLAVMFGISHVTLTNRFVRVTGITPMEYLNRIRMHNACELLSATDLPISVISDQCGYENQFYFSRVFHRRMGISPTEYRKQSQV